MTTPVTVVMNPPSPPESPCAGPAEVASVSLVWSAGAGAQVPWFQPLLMQQCGALLWLPLSDFDFQSNRPASSVAVQV